MSTESLLELDALATQLDAVRDRLAALVGPSVEPIVDEALEELRTSVEELRTADEQLRAQNDELTAAQIALELERAQLASLFDEAPDAYLLTDEHAIIVRVNRPSERLFGLTSAILVGKPLAVLVSPKDRRAFRTFVARVRRDAAEPLVARIVRRDRVPLWAEFQVSALPGAGGEELRWVVRDLTDRVQAERILWELNAELETRVEERTAELDGERARLEALLRELPVGVLIVDAKTQRIEAANALATQLLGPEISTAGIFRAPYVLRSASGEPIPPDELPSAVTARTRERVLATRYRLETPRGTVPVEISTNAVLGDAGDLASIVLTIEDVTVRERRERADHDFVSNAAHQLRTPLTAIAGAIAVLQSGAKDVPVERDRFLAHVERETNRLARLGRALLTLARAQRGESDPDVTVVAIRPMLEAIAGDAAHGDGVAVSVECPLDVAALATPELLEEALSNLVENAIAYARGGDIVIRADAANDVTVIDVVDTGPGIAPQDQQRVFERFYRAQGSSQAGFGLGLPIAKAAVEAMAGSIEIVPGEGSGTTIRVSIPAARLVL